MVVGPVELRARNALLEPAQQGFVAHVHPERDVRLSPVPTEVALPDEEAHDETLFERSEIEACHAAQSGSLPSGKCFTGV
jgi:hypothetical protein